MAEDKDTLTLQRVDAQQIGTQPFTFRDKAFKSRTFVFIDGSTVPVTNGLISVSARDMVEQLEQHSDFERTLSGA